MKIVDPDTHAMEMSILSLEVIEQINKEWEMCMDQDFPNWREYIDEWNVPHGN